MDVQGSSGMFGGGAAGGGPAISGDYARSLEASVARSFPGNHCINCMVRPPSHVVTLATLANRVATTPNPNQPSPVSQS